MNSTLLVIDLEDKGYMLLSLLKDIIPYTPSLYHNDRELFDYNYLISSIRTEFTTQLIQNIMVDETEYELNLLNLPDWRYLEHISEFSDAEVKSTLGTAIRTYGMFLYRTLKQQIQKFSVSLINDILLSTVTSSYVALTIVHKELPDV